MVRAPLICGAIGLLLTPCFAVPQDVPAPATPPGQVQQVSAGTISFHLMAIKTGVDQTTGDYEVALLGRILLSQELPEGGSLVLEAKVTDAGIKGTHGIWFYNPKLRRFCARLLRQETIAREQLLPLPGGTGYDFLWETRISRHKRPLFEMAVAATGGIQTARLTVTVDPEQPTGWFVAAPRYVNGASEITLPATSSDVAAGFVQFMSYGCLKPPYTAGKAIKGDTTIEVPLEDSGAMMGCRWWFTQPVRVDLGEWEFQPPEAAGFSQTPVPFKVVLYPGEDEEDYPSRLF